MPSDTFKRKDDDLPTIFGTGTHQTTLAGSQRSLDPTDPIPCARRRTTDAGRVKVKDRTKKRAYSRASSGFVCYLHYRLLVRMTNKYDGTSAVFAAVLSLARVLFQWFPTFWTINHLQIPSWITREDDVKML